MERLTFEVHDGGMFVKESDVKTFDVEDEVMHTGNAIRKLAEYEDLEEQGKLLKLPCAVGDTVYSVSFRKKCYKMGNTYLLNDTLECAFCESESVCNAKNEYFIEEIKATLPIIANLINRPDEFMIFLTKPEAEQALKEMEGKK